MMLLFFALLVLGSCKSDRYYEMVKDYNTGIDYYRVLGVTSSATSTEIKKAYRALLLILHPDKNKEEGALEKFLLMQKSYELLNDPETKAEWDRFLTDGIPFQDQYYGRYMHAWGAPQHDPWMVVLGMIIIITIAKYLLQIKRHHDLNEMVKMTQRYKRQVNAQKSAGEDASVEYVVHGAELPTWKDLFAVQLVIFLVWFPVKTYRFLTNLPEFVSRLTNGMTEEELDEIRRQKLGMTPEEYANAKEQHMRKMEEMMKSNKAKRMRRWLKKHPQ